MVLFLNWCVNIGYQMTVNTVRVPLLQFISTWSLQWAHEHR